MLHANGIGAPQRTVKAIPPEHLRNQVLIDKMKIFDSCIRKKLGGSMRMQEKKSDKASREWIPYEDDETRPHTIPENDISLDNFNVSLTDSLIKDEVLLHRGEVGFGPLIKDRVIRYLTHENANVIGQANKKINLKNPNA